MSRPLSMTLAGCLAVGAGLAGAATASGATTRGPAAILGGPGHALVYPSGMEVAPDGTLVVADTGNDSVAKFSPTGRLLWRVAAGAAEGDEAENARDIAIDDDGFIYVADAAEFRIIKLDKNGKVVGTPWKGPAGDRLGSPIGITANAGRVYVSDGAKRKIRVFDTAGTQLRSYSAAGACDLSAVRDADADAAGNIYVANYKNNNIVKFSASGSCVKTWGTKGSGNGQFKNPYGVRVATDPRWGEVVYVADSNNNRIQVFTTDGAFKASVGSTGTFDQNGRFTTLRRVAVAADGDIWGADLWGWRLVRFNRTASGYAYAQTIGGARPPVQDRAVFNEPRALAVRPDGKLDVIDTVNQRVVTLSATGSVLEACGQRDSRPVSVNWPRGIAIDPVTSDRWIADTKQSRLQIVRSRCGLQSYRLGGIGTGVGQFNWPHAIAIRAADRLAFVADTKNNRVTVWDVATRTALDSYAAGLNSPRALSIDQSGRIVVGDSGNGRIVVLDYTRAGGFTLDSTLTPPGLSFPEGVARDASGKYWISDTGNNRVVVVNPAGSIVRTIKYQAGKALSKPGSITVDGAKIYVSDTNNDRIIRFGG